MAFSLRSFFGKEKSPENSAPNGAASLPNPGTHGQHATQLPNPGGFHNGSLFKTTGVVQPGGQPVGSPFSPFSKASPTSSTNEALTVDDVLPHLPVEVARNPQLAPGQPLQLSEEVVSKALRGGHAAIPLFEIYRVCPALFQTPISPQDARTVPLPPHKIASLIPVGAAVGVGVGQESSSLFNPSPFSVSGAEPTESAAVALGFGAGAPFQMGGASSAPLNALNTPGGGGSPFMPAPGVTVSTGAFPQATTGGGGLPPAGNGMSASPFGAANPFSFPAAPETASEPPAPPPFPMGGPSASGSGSSPFAFPATGAPPPLAATGSPFAPFPSSGELPASPPAASPFSVAMPPAAPVESAPSWLGSAAPSPFSVDSPTASFHESSGASPFAFTGGTPASPAPAEPSASAEPPPWMQTSPAAAGSHAASASTPSSSPFSFGPAAAPAAPAPVSHSTQSDDAPSWLQGSSGAPNPALNGSSGASPFSFTPAPVVPSAPAVEPPAAPPFTFAAAPPVPAPVQPPAENPFAAATSVPPPVSTSWQPAGPAPTSQPLPWEAPAPVPAPPSAKSPGQEAAFPSAPASTPPVTAESVPSPFARIAALVGAPIESVTPAAPVPAEEPSPLVNPSTPDISAFGRSFDLPPAGKPLESANKPFADGVSFGLPGAKGEEQRSSANPSSSSSSGSGEFIKLPLASLVKNCTAQDIGIAPDLIPSWVQTAIPQSLINSQSSTGRISLTLAEIVQGLDAEMRHLIIPAYPGMKIEVPATDLLASSPIGSTLAGKGANTPPTAGHGTSPLPSGVPWPFDVSATKPEAAPVAPAKTVLPKPVTATPAPATPPATAFTPATTPPSLSSVPPAFQAQGPVSVPASAKPETKMPIPGANLSSVSRHQDKHQQMLLRVLLGSQEEEFDADAVVRLTTSQPGVAAAVCFVSGKPVSTSGNGSPEAEHFLRQAERMHEHVQPLVALTGIDDTETVSVKSDRHVVTFSLQGKVTLGVLHDPQQQEATLREKVTLIARELTSLLQAA